MRTCWCRATRVLTGLAVLGGLVAASGCAAAPDAPRGVLTVTAGENFWGDLAAQVGGGHVQVTSILSNPNADPHLYAPDTRAGLAVAEADVVIRNGAGYDPWLDRLLAAAPSDHRRVLTVATVIGVSGADPNPHLWYDTPALPKVVTAMAAVFAAADPGHAAGYRAGAAATIARLGPLERAVDQLRRDHAGVPVAYTERVPGLLLQAAGLAVLTPPGFARAVEDGTDPAPADVAAMQALITGHRIRVLLYNEQASDPSSVAVRQLAVAAGVPVVAVTETLPPGQTFESWQLAQCRALAAALR